MVVHELTDQNFFPCFHHCQSKCRLELDSILTVSELKSGRLDCRRHRVKETLTANPISGAEDREVVVIYIEALGDDHLSNEIAKHDIVYAIYL
jgi:hypothetical protein